MTVGMATIRPRPKVSPRLACRSPIAVTGPGCGGTKPCIADSPARAGIPTVISETWARRATR